MNDLRIGIIGCGAAGTFHARRFVETVKGASVVALADPSEAIRRRCVERVFGDGLPAPLEFSDYPAMLAASELDAVMISSPHAFHFEQAADALEAGCHVLVDKPMVTSSADARTLAERARESGRVVSIALQGPFSGAHRYARGLLESGALGDVYLVTGLCSQPWLRFVKGTWRTDPALSGGGNLIDSGSHLFAAILTLSGQVPVEVFASVDRKDQEVDVVAVVALRFDGGALGTAAVSGDSPAMEEGVYVHGTVGSIKAGIYGDRVERWEDDRRLLAYHLPEGETPETNFARCIRGEAETDCPPELGVRLALLHEAIRASAEAGTPVPVELT